MSKIEDIAKYLEPVRKTVVVRRNPAEAFEIFTQRISSWWPFASFSMVARNPPAARWSVAVTEGTRVELEHRSWEKLGARAAEGRQGYDEGWNVVFLE